MWSLFLFTDLPELLTRRTSDFVSTKVSSALTYGTLEAYEPPSLTLPTWSLPPASIPKDFSRLNADQHTHTPTTHMSYLDFSIVLMYQQGV